MLHKDVLPNGLRVVTEELPYVHSVSLGIWVGTGSRYENKAVHGVSHFLEHMLFKGTPSRTAKQIAESLEMVGGHLNAFTSKEHTCYYAKVLNEHFDLAAEVLADMFLNSSFLAGDMDKERNVILEEIKMYEDTPDELVHDICAKTLWPDHSLGQSIIGTIETVGNLSRDQLINYYQATYVPENVVIAVVGNIKREQVLEKMAALFSGFLGRFHPPGQKRPGTFSDVVFVGKDIEQMHLCLGSPGLPHQHDHIYTLSVLNNILGGGISSRLFQEVREERGLTYTIYSYHSGYSDAGIMGVYAGTSLENTEIVTEIILRQIADLKKRGITDEELEKTKQHIKGTILLGLENIGNRMNRLGKSEISFGRIVTPEEIVASVMKVTNEDVIQIARQVFPGDRFVLAAVGPEKPLLNFPEMVKKADL